MFNHWQNCKPSRFINELSQQDIEIIHQGGPVLRKHLGINFSANKYNFKKAEYRSDTFNQGDKITHDKFGVGVIKSTIGDVVEVVFDSGCTRFVTGKDIKKA